MYNVSATCCDGQRKVLGPHRPVGVGSVSRCIGDSPESEEQRQVGSSARALGVSRGDRAHARGWWLSPVRTDALTSVVMGSRKRRRPSHISDHCVHVSRPIASGQYSSLTVASHSEGHRHPTLEAILGRVSDGARAPRRRGFGHSPGCVGCEAHLRLPARDAAHDQRADPHDALPEGIWQSLLGRFSNSFQSDGTSRQSPPAALRYKERRTQRPPSVLKACSIRSTYPSNSSGDSPSRQSS